MAPLRAMMRTWNRIATRCRKRGRWWRYAVAWPWWRRYRARPVPPVARVTPATPWAETRQRVVRALNPVGAAVGDRVLMTMPRRAVLGASFLVYMVPVLALLAGAVVGQRLGPAWGLSPTGGAVLLGLAALAAAWLALRIVSRNLGRRESFQVKIVRVVQKGEVDAVDQHSAGL